MVSVQLHGVCEGPPLRTCSVTLFEAVGLVILVVFVFLQNWRATLIPLLTVPVADGGHLRAFSACWDSPVNITSMFGLVLAIGIVVDDAIVVVEAVQRNIDEGMAAPPGDHPAPCEEVSAPVVAIACILAAVFIPGGFPGWHQRPDLQAVRPRPSPLSVLLSAFNALSLSPALSALILRPKSAQPRTAGPRSSEASTGPSTGPPTATWPRVRALIRKSALALVGTAVLAGSPPVRIFKNHAHRLPAG